jgi:peptidoglycan lytic transglycosylase A
VTDGKTEQQPGLFRKLIELIKGAVITAPLFFAGTASAMQQNPQLPDYFQKSSFADLAGWGQDDLLSALHSFLRFCAKPEVFKNSSVLSLSQETIGQLCKAADRAANSSDAARRYFEEHFTPYKVIETGFVTGYFEPEVAASRIKTEKFFVPLHQKPSGHETITAENRPKAWPDHLSHGRRKGKTLTELPDRGAIMDGALDDEKLELVWLEDPIDAYFIHVQGSARLRLADGSVMRVGYAGKTGHPYTGIGRRLVKRGEGTPDDFTMSGLRSWLKDNPDQRDALFKENRSYIFFREVTETGAGDGPIGAAGLPLIPGRSLAIDPKHFPYGALVHVASKFPDRDQGNSAFARLLVTDDTGSAIKGIARGDIFVGSGRQAGQIAGDIRHKAEFTILLPNLILDGTSEAVD